ncbi:MAG: PrsW family glutamic-type intramembrane protease [Oscillospiraceae bacterium]|nr:PrsW family glutamic-type intramembrane protease [Oscillospiraceae bacterium]
MRQTLSSLYRLSLSTLRSASIDKSVYLIQNGADRFSFIFFRGFGTGAMHVLCGLIVGGGLTYAWQRTWLKIAGTCGLLGAAITLHAIYNLLIAYGGAAQYVAYALPVLLVAAGKLSAFRLGQRK